MTSLRQHRVLLGVLVSLYALLAAISVVPGPLLIDDVAYHMMARDWLERGDLEIWNGYRETPSPELEVLVPTTATQVTAHQGRLVSQYPYLSPILALPFYAAGGFAGLGWLNALASGLSLALTWSLARRHFGLTAAWLSVSLLGLGSFFVIHAMASTPMATGALASLAATLLLEQALHAGTRRLALSRALAAGLALGLGAGVRLDVATFAALLGAICLLEARPRWELGLAMAVGMTPGLAILSWTNHLKFGIWSPLSYGNDHAVTSGVGTYLPALATGLGGLAALWALTQDRPRSWLLARRERLLIPLGLLLLALLIPAARTALIRLGVGAWTLGVDLRAIPDYGTEITDKRLPSGAILYWDTLKKSMLQSWPALAALALPLVAVLRAGPERASLLRLLIPPLGLLVFWAWRASHGGAGLHLRYFLPVLPHLSILLAWTLLEMARPAPRRALGAGLLGAAACLFGYFTYLKYHPDPELPWLDLPVAVGGLIGLASLLWLAGPRLLPRTITVPLLAATTGAGLAWGALATWALDLPVERQVRAERAHHGQIAARYVPDDSLIFAPIPERVSTAIDHRRIRIASPYMDSGHDLGALVAWHSARGIPCYTFFKQNHWQDMERMGALTGLRAETVWSEGPWTLTMLSPSPSSGPLSAP